MKHLLSVISIIFIFTACLPIGDQGKRRIKKTACTEDTQCTAIDPSYICLSGGFCGECDSKEDCDDEKICSENHVCEPASSGDTCTKHSDCNTDNRFPACNTSLGVCVQCTADKVSACSGDTSKCALIGLNANKCVQCVDNASCTNASKPRCAVSGLNINKCVKCNLNEECEGTKVCFKNDCKPLLLNYVLLSDCTGNSSASCYYIDDPNKINFTCFCSDFQWKIAKGYECSPDYAEACVAGFFCVSNICSDKAQ